MVFDLFAAMCRAAIEKHCLIGVNKRKQIMEKQWLYEILSKKMLSKKRERAAMKIQKKSIPWSNCTLINRNRNQKGSILGTMCM